MAGHIALLAFLGVGFLSCEARLRFSLDGSWDFALDAANPTTQRLSAVGGRVGGSIEVPGAWQVPGTWIP